VANPLSFRSQRAIGFTTPAPGRELPPRGGAIDRIRQFLRVASVIETHVDEFGAVANRIVDGAQDVRVVAGSVGLERLQLEVARYLNLWRPRSGPKESPSPSPATIPAQPD
jgi:hypothetical protein